MWLLGHVRGWRVRARRPDVPLPPDQPLVAVFNHTSTIDGFLIAHTVWRGLGRWVQPLVKAELFEVPVLSTLARGAGATPVHRTEDAGRETAYADAVAVLLGGGTVLIAPEGTVTHDGSLLPLRHGAARLALEAGVDVLVITHFGAQRGFSPVVRFPERGAVVTMAMDVLTPYPDEDATSLTGRIAATMIDRSVQLRAAYPEQRPAARWWPPYAAPASPTGVARENLERYQESMSQAIAQARDRMARYALEHDLDQRLAEARERARVAGAELAEARERAQHAAAELAARSRERAELMTEHARERAGSLSEQARDRMDDLTDQARELTDQVREGAADLKDRLPTRSDDEGTGTQVDGTVAQIDGPADGDRG
jgi:1-acyl-sn-glycerol-3-phosphate acyltransferase